MNKRGLLLAISVFVLALSVPTFAGEFTYDEITSLDFREDRQPNNQSPVLVQATVRIAVDDADRGTINFKVAEDPADLPLSGSIKGSVIMGQGSGGLSTDESLITSEFLVTGIVPRGWTYRIENVSSVGDPSMSLTRVQEVTMPVEELDPKDSQCSQTVKQNQNISCIFEPSFLNGTPLTGQTPTFDITLPNGTEVTETMTEKNGLGVYENKFLASLTGTHLIVMNNTLDGTNYASAQFVEVQEGFKNDDSFNQTDRDTLNDNNAKITETNTTLFNLDSYIRTTLTDIVNLTKNYVTNGTLVDLIWDEVLTGSTHNVQNSAGKILRQLKDTNPIVREGQAQTGGENTITLDAGASSVDEFYKENVIVITSGTGINQVNMILSYNGTTKRAWMADNWLTPPDSSSNFIIFANEGQLATVEGRANGATANTIILENTPSNIDQVYKDQVIYIASGTGHDQARLIKDYDNATQTVTLYEDWAIQPDENSTYVINPFGETIPEAFDNEALTNITNIFNKAQDTNNYVTNGTLVDNIWDETCTNSNHNGANSACKLLRQIKQSLSFVRDGTAQGGDHVSITLDAGASSVDNFYDPSYVAIVSGTGAGQARAIIGYNGTTKKAYINKDWRVIPDSSSDFVIASTGGTEAINDGLVTNAGSNWIVLNNYAETVDDSYVGQIIQIRAGSGRDQVRIIQDYDGATRNASLVEPWNTIPQGGNATYVIEPEGRSAPVFFLNGANETIKSINDTVKTENNENEAKLDIIDTVVDDTQSTLNSLDTFLRNVWGSLTAQDLANNQTTINDNLISHNTTMTTEHDSINSTAEGGNGTSPEAVWGYVIDQSRNLNASEGLLEAWIDRFRGGY